MTGSERLTATLLGAALMLSPLNARGWQSPNVANGTLPETSPASASTGQRTPAEMPPNPPKVTCENGNLTISATNSTMGAVMNAIHNCTGAQIEIPEGAKGERLFAQLGPGPVRAVLAEFLSSTDFNYAIKASPSDPQKVQMVFLNPRSSDSAKEVVTEAAANDTMSSNRRAWLEARHNYEQPIAPPDEEPMQPTDVASSAPPQAETPAQPANSIPAATEPLNSAPAVTSLAPTPEAEISSGSAGSGAASSQGKSTQEMISDMQRMFEQRKQMMQQQPPQGTPVQ